MSALETIVSAIVGGLLVAVSPITLPFAALDVYKRCRRKPGCCFCKRYTYVLPDKAKDPRWGKHRMVPANGLNFHVVCKGDPNKPLLLCIHGFPECWYSWRHQLEHFSDRFFVVAVDMRGYGESDRPGGSYRDWRNYGVGHIVEDVRQLIGALGYEKATLFSHDWGGSIAWSIADSHPEVVERLVVCNAPHAETFVKNMGLAQLKRSWYMLFNQMPLIPELWFRFRGFESIPAMFLKPPYGVHNPKHLTPEDVEVFRYYISRPGALTAAINWYRAMFTGSDPPPPKEKVSPVPTLVIWGTKDAALGMETIKGIEKHVADVTIKPVDGASHWVEQEEPDKVNQLIEEWMAMK